MWVVILQNTDDVRPIYIGSSKKKADKIASENEDIDRCTYCYVKLYEKEKKLKGD